MCCWQSLRAMVDEENAALHEQREAAEFATNQRTLTLCSPEALSYRDHVFCFTDPGAEGNTVVRLLHHAACFTALYTGRQTDRQTHTHAQTDRQTHTHTHPHTFTH